MAQELTCYNRQETGKGAARRLRARAMIPGVVYGHNTATVPVAVPELEFMALWRGMQGKQVMLELVIRDEDGGGEEKRLPGLLQDYQHDPLARRFLHLDFHQVLAREKIRVAVPLELVGEAPGERQGGVVDQILREIEVEALPADLPEKLSVDIGALGLGDSLPVSALTVAAGVQVLAHAEDPIVTVLAPRKSEEDAETEAAAAEEPSAGPEVISAGEAEERRGKKESDS